jgi:dipeptidyl aminopeptidase/acylaminoacyl peptidase
VLVYSHGGDAGVSTDELLLLFLALGAASSNYVWVVPSFRGEELRGGTESYWSGGEPSPWDRDVDDALALISAVLAHEPATDPERVAVLGFSRGAGVGLLMAARDSRIDAAVCFFGPTDFFDPWVRDIVEEALQDQVRDLPGLAWLNESYIQPLRQGMLSVEVVRMQLVRRSAVLFAASLPAVQIHHGTADSVVSVSQAQRLDQVMRALGRTLPSYQLYLYPGGGHNPLTLPGSVDRTAAFLADFAAGTLSAAAQSP